MYNYMIINKSYFWIIIKSVVVHIVLFSIISYINLYGWYLRYPNKGI